MNLKNIIEMLRLDDHYGQSEAIDIAKGRNKLEYGFKNIYKQKRRKWHRKGL